MPNCSAPGCKVATPQKIVSLFSRCQTVHLTYDTLGFALSIERIADLKVVYICAKHFETEDIDYVHVVPRGDGSSHEVPRARPKLKPGAVPSLLPGCPSYYSSTGAKRSRFSFDSREEDLLNQALSLSLKSDKEDTEKYLVNSLQDGKIS